MKDFTFMGMRICPRNFVPEGVAIIATSSGDPRGNGIALGGIKRNHDGSWSALAVPEYAHNAHPEGTLSEPVTTDGAEGPANAPK